MAAEAPGEVSVYIGLGSNLLDRAEQIRRALCRLDRELGVRVRRASSLYESAPVGYLAQPAFLNAVAELATTLPAEFLLRRMKQIERDLGRRPAPRWGPREIDLDILIYDDQHLSTDLLIVPHPLMAQRAFVMVPLAELWPDYHLPDGLTARQVAEKLRLQQEIVWYAPMPSWRDCECR